ncbi:MAG: hypothetical protein ACPG7W_07080, partial [Paracoccaceae bacterium]
PNFRLRLVAGLVGVSALVACGDAPQSAAPTTSSAEQSAGRFIPKTELLYGTMYCLDALERNLRRAPTFRQKGYFRRPNGGYIKQGTQPLFSGVVPPKAIVQYVPKSRSAPVHSCVVALEGATRPSRLKGVSKAEGNIFDFVALAALAKGFTLTTTQGEDGKKVFILKNTQGTRMQLVSRVIVSGKARTMLQTLVRLP